MFFKTNNWKWNTKYGFWVSNFGEVRTKEGKAVRKFTQHRYLTVYSEKAEALIKIHRLVLMTWKPRKNMENLTVDHLDGNRFNIQLTNLEWVTEEENWRRAGHNVSPDKRELFLLVVDGINFYYDTKKATEYVKQKLEYTDSILFGEERTISCFNKLKNAYRNNDAYYLNNNFTIEKYNCVFTIIKI